MYNSGKILSINSPEKKKKCIDECHKVAVQWMVNVAAFFHTRSILGIQEIEM